MVEVMVDSDGDLIVVGSRTERVGLWRFQEGEVLTPAGFVRVRVFMKRSPLMPNSLR